MPRSSRRHHGRHRRGRGLLSRPRTLQQSADDLSRHAPTNTHRYTYYHVFNVPTSRIYRSGEIISCSRHELCTTLTRTLSMTTEITIAHRRVPDDNFRHR